MSQNVSICGTSFDFVDNSRTYVDNMLRCAVLPFFTFGHIIYTGFKIHLRRYLTHSGAISPMREQLNIEYAKERKLYGW